MYTIDEIVKINKEYEKMHDFVEDRVRKICSEIGFIDKTWDIERFEIDNENIYVTAYDTLYDMYDWKNTVFPLSWITSDSWREEWEKQQEIKKQKEKEEKKRQDKLKEDKEYLEFLRLSEKFSNR